MHIEEATTLTKIAIICTLVTMLIGACLSVWYLMWDNTTEIERKLERASSSASAEKLYQLQDQSMAADESDSSDKIKEHPLVTTAANTLSEFDEDSLLYIYVVNTPSSQPNTPKGANLYTYENYTISDHGTGRRPAGWESKQVYNSNNPVTDAVKYLLTYSQYRCHLHIQEVTNSGNSYIGIIIEVLT